MNEIDTHVKAFMQSPHNSYLRLKYKVRVEVGILSFEHGDFDISRSLPKIVMTEVRHTRGHSRKLKIGVGGQPVVSKKSRPSFSIVKANL